MNQATLETFAKWELRRQAGIEAKKKQQAKRRDKASFAVARAIKAGEIPKASELKCDRCPSPAAEYHHHNGYDEVHWLDVIPLCVSCHRRLEKKSYPCCQGVRLSGEPCRTKVSPLSGGYCYVHLFQGFTPLEIRLASEIVILKEKLERASQKIKKLSTGQGQTRLSSDH